MGQSYMLLVGIVCLLSGPTILMAICPPKSFDSVPDFNLTKYIAAPWYIQQQMVNSYQLEQDFYCVRAKYVPEDPTDYSKGIVVQNYRNRGGVNQNPGGSSGAGGGNCFGYDQIKAFPAKSEASEPTDESKILVGPAPLAAFGKALLGDYWVVAVGTSENSTIGYDWAIVSAGAPNVTSNSSCRTGTEEMQRDRRVVNGVGLWLFSRKATDPEGIVVMRAKAEELGFDTSVLLNVTQQGCTYTAADPVCTAAPPGPGCSDLSFNTSTIPVNITVRCVNGSLNGTGPPLWNMTAPPRSNTTGGAGANMLSRMVAVGGMLVAVAMLTC